MRNKLIIVMLMTALVTQFVFSSDEGKLLSDGFKEIVDSEIKFQWKIEGDQLRIRLSAQTEGWVAIGFNPSKAMKGADFKLAYVDGATVYMEDHFGTGMFAHKQDTTLNGTSDFEIVEGSEDMEVTTIEFLIPLDSGDPNDKVLSEGDEVKVLLAYGTRDNLSQQHKKRTSIMVKL